MKRLLALSLVLLAAAPVTAEKPSGPWSAAVRDKMLTQTEAELQSYFFLERLPAIRSAIEANRTRLVAINDPEQFADETSKVLYGATRDKHVGIDYSSLAEPPMTDKPSDADRAKMDALMRYHSYALRGTAFLRGNIGYFRIDGFVPGKEAYAMIDETMSTLANTDALIIDLRSNGGGSARCVDYLLGYFFGTKQEVTGFLHRENGHVLTDRKYTEDVAGPKYLNKPVFLLTSSDTISGGEQFPYDLQALKRATIVGQTTAGGANPGGFHQLTENFSVFVPTGSARNPVTGTNWEGVGVIPDVKSDAKHALLEAYARALKVAGDPSDFAVQARQRALRDPAKALAESLPEY